MPNWCYNHLEITGPAETVTAFKEASTLADSGALSFDRLVPMPEELRAPEAGDAWYNWSVDNWGTKWDVSGDPNQGGEKNLGNGLAQLAYNFDTAWAPPVPWLEKVAPQFLTLTFSLWFDEPGSNFAGRETFANGELDEFRSWSAESLSGGGCSVTGCEEYAEGKSVAEFLSAPTDEDYELFCAEHALVQAVVVTLRAAGETVHLTGQPRR